MPYRYTTRPFPPYRYIPGRAPHPIRDPQGYAHGELPPALPSFDAGRWADCDGYLYGIDLFNHGYWWEAHEALESCWVAAGRTTGTGRFLQGLIQIAVACLKHEQGFAGVARRLAREGLEKLSPGPVIHLGVDVARLGRDVRVHLDGGPAPQIRLTGVAHPE
jgi:hypothetical protein